jgi:hypothetical protein
LIRYCKKSFGDLFGFSGKWLGLYLEILSDSRALFRIFVDCDLILQKDRGLHVRWWGFSGSDLFLNGKYGGLGS